VPPFSPPPSKVHHSFCGVRFVACRSYPFSFWQIFRDRLYPLGCFRKPLIFTRVPPPFFPSLTALYFCRPTFSFSHPFLSFLLFFRAGTRRHSLSAYFTQLSSFLPQICPFFPLAASVPKGSRGELYPRVCSSFPFLRVCRPSFSPQGARNGAVSFLIKDLPFFSWNGYNAGPSRPSPPSSELPCDRYQLWLLPCSPPLFFPRKKRHQKGPFR